MGMSKLEEIASAYIAQGKGETPAAIIQNGTLPNQKVGVGTVGELAAIAGRGDLRNPAVIVVGEVVRFHEAFQSVKDKLAAEFKIAV